MSELVGTRCSLQLFGKVALGTLVVGMLVVPSWRSFGGWGLGTGKMLGCFAPVTWFMVIATTLREGIHLQRTFTFKHCPNHLNPLSPQFRQLGPLFRTSKTTFCAYDRKNADDDNDGCNDNYDGNFDDNDDKNYQKNIQK